MRTASLALLSLAAAVPSLSFPFNSQLPPVARWGEPYSYTFSSDTFGSTDGQQLKYSGDNLPSWLSLNGSTLTGTPQGGSGDSQVSFNIIASDKSGNTTDQCKLQITDSAQPTFSKQELEQVLTSSGRVANSDSFVLVAGQPFNVTFPKSFFSNVSRDVIGYYAVTSDHAPLPIWLNFDGAKGTFSGTAPSVNSEIAQAQQFSILYIISTFQGFESTAAEFKLLLGANTFTMNLTKDTVQATTNKSFDYAVPLTQISLNGQPITQANLSKSNANIPADSNWLKWNEANFTLSGIPPTNASGKTIAVQIDMTDVYNDAVSWEVDVVVNSENKNTVFSTSSLPSANATRGQWFSYDMSKYVLNKDVQLALSSSVDWLTVHNDNLTVNGKVPDDFKSTVVDITATLENQKRDTGITHRHKRAEDGLTAHFQLIGVDSSTTTTSSSSSSTSTSSSTSSSSASQSSSSATATSSQSAASGSATSTSTSTAPLNKASHSKGVNKVAIGCGVGIPVGLILIAAIILLCFCCARRRRNNKDKTEEGPGYGDTIDDSQISNPRPSSKGMVMAPVFRTVSSDSESFVDAPEFPGEMADDGTIISLSEKGLKKDSGDTSEEMDFQSQAIDHSNSQMNTPQRASTLNFLAMDGPNSSQTTLSTEPTAPIGADNSTGAVRNDIPVQREEDDVVGDFVPRESWRHTNTGERRWQDHRFSHSSLASITPTEPPTVQLTSGEFTGNSAHDNETTQPQMQREYSSGVLHRVGSHSSSHYSVVHTRGMSQEIGRHYRTDSSTDSQDSGELSDHSVANFRPYRDENGELHWREEAQGTTTRLGGSNLDRKPSQSKTPKGDQGEFVFV